MDGSVTAPAATVERLPARRGLVQREPLFRRMSAAGPGGVVLLSAPAGSTRRCGTRTARRPARRRGVNRAGARARRTRRDDLAVRARPGRRPPRAPPAAPYRSRHLAHDDPRPARRIPAARPTAATGRRAQRRRTARPQVPAQQPQSAQIASDLCISANTVRTHLRHIYAKLGAHNRSEAVARGREQRLLGPRAA